LFSVSPQESGALSPQPPGIFSFGLTPAGAGPGAARPEAALVTAASLTIDGGLVVWLQHVGAWMARACCENGLFVLVLLLVLETLAW